MAQSLYRQASLVMNPYGAKDTLLPSIKPTDGSGDFTFSRDGAGASPATRVNASGLIEKGRTNNILYSQEYGGAGTANWANVGSATITTDNTIAPDGTITADKLAKASGSTSGVYQIVTTTSGGLYNISVYLKDDSNCDDMLLGCDLNPSNANLRFNPQTGVASSIGAGVIDYSVSNEGSGWYRVSLSYVATGTTNTFLIYNLSAVASSCFAWGAQHENGLVATDYIETTTAPVSDGLLGDMPRLDYSGGATCGSLLLEPSRTNLFTQSEYFGAWSLSNATLTANDAESPEGVVNGYKLKENTANSTHRITQTSLVTAGQIYTQSVFAKGDGSSRYLRMFRGSGTYNFAVFNLTSGEIVSQGGSNLISTNIEAYSNGWYKCSITFTAQFSNIASYIGLQNESLDSYTGDGTSGIYIYGATLEAGSYETSYIPTYGSASTRGAEDCAIANTGDIIADSKGSFFIDINVNMLDSDGLIPVTAGVGTAALYYLWLTTGRAVRSEWYNGGVLQALIQTSVGYFNIGDRLKIAVAYQDNDFVMYVNGTLIGTDTSGTAPSPTLLKIGQYNSDDYTGGAINQFLVFPTRLTNAELAALTA